MSSQHLPVLLGKDEAKPHYIKICVQLTIYTDYLLIRLQEELLDQIGWLPLHLPRGKKPLIIIEVDLGDTRVEREDNFANRARELDSFVQELTLAKDWGFLLNLPIVKRQLDRWQFSIITSNLNLLEQASF